VSWDDPRVTWGDSTITWGGRIGVDPVLDYERPDVEALVFHIARPVGGVTSWAYSVLETQGLRGWVSATSLQVDVRAKDRRTARLRADQVRRSVCALPFVPWDGGVVARVQVLEGPFWFPDEDGQPRYVARYEVLAHPLPALV
jgi:hypothetical protein